jgi:hypothetical protein
MDVSIDKLPVCFARANRGFASRLGELWSSVTKLSSCRSRILLVSRGFNRSSFAERNWSWRSVISFLLRRWSSSRKLASWFIRKRNTLIFFRSLPFMAFCSSMEPCISVVTLSSSTSCARSISLRSYSNRSIRFDSVSACYSEILAIDRKASISPFCFVAVSTSSNIRVDGCLPFSLLITGD